MNFLIRYVNRFSIKVCSVCRTFLNLTRELIELIFICRILYYKVMLGIIFLIS